MRCQIEGMPSPKWGSLASKGLWVVVRDPPSTQLLEAWTEVGKSAAIASRADACFLSASWTFDKGGLGESLLG